jgi:hypothetical protein
MKKMVILFAVCVLALSGCVKNQATEKIEDAASSAEKTAISETAVFDTVFGIETENAATGPEITEKEQPAENRQEVNRKVDASAPAAKSPAVGVEDEEVEDEPNENEKITEKRQEIQEMFFEGEAAEKLKVPAANARRALSAMEDMF